MPPFDQDGPKKEILGRMEEDIAAIRNLQRNFDFYSRRLETLMKKLNDYHLEREGLTFDRDEKAKEEEKRRERK